MRVLKGQKNRGPRAFKQIRPKIPIYEQIYRSSTKYGCTEDAAENLFLSKFSIIQVPKIALMAGFRNSCYTKQETSKSFAFPHEINSMSTKIPQKCSNHNKNTLYIHEVSSNKKIKEQNQLLSPVYEVGLSWP